MTTHLEIVQQAYGAFGRGDVAGLLATMDPTIVWENPGPESPVYFGTHHGHAAVAKNVLGFLAENLVFDVFEPREFLTGADKVVVLLHVEARVKRTNERIVHSVVHIFHIAGGKVVRFQDFQDSYALAKALAV